MKVLHIATECYPAAKAGGMGDVVGALPLYMPNHNIEASVIIPKYKTPWILNQKWNDLNSIDLNLNGKIYSAKIQILKESKLTYDLFVVDIPGLFDRASIYLDENGEGYSDEIERYIAFQRTVLDWLLIENRFEVLHCHDHMTGLLMFMIKHCPLYKPIKHLPTVFTIHNGQYRGVINWKWYVLLPQYNSADSGVLDWDGSINSLATAIKTCHAYTTVSPSYLREIQDNSDTLTPLMQSESYKSFGIINGIDDTMWDPSKDPMISFTLKRSINNFKLQNKKALAKQYSFNHKKALVGFIGRFAYQKGADLLAKAYGNFLSKSSDIHFFILGSGDKNLEAEVLRLKEKYPSNVTAEITYNEALAHKVYAASDFLIMPSRFEPCGLNQMYAMRYGSVPVVRHTGGLKDTVPDIGDGGVGISFLQDSVNDIEYSLDRALHLFTNKEQLKLLREKIINIDFSWNQSSKQYAKLYQKILK